jgi:hypothetical protein
MVQWSLLPSCVSLLLLLPLGSSQLHQLGCGERAHLSLPLHTYHHHLLLLLLLARPYMLPDAGLPHCCWLLHVLPQWRCLHRL